uniref:C2H2-type domain-containing protein n=1 Tax=Strix occidentalis caurina TaxID=311401 RepID=A0A8D0FHP1_STROC
RVKPVCCVRVLTGLVLHGWRLPAARLDSASHKKTPEAPKKWGFCCQRTNLCALGWEGRGAAPVLPFCVAARHPGGPGRAELGRWSWAQHTGSTRRPRFLRSPLKPYGCEECGKSYRLISLLNLHKKRHTGEAKYRCDDCGKLFTTSGNLKRHQLVHSGEKPYQCDYCGRSFSDPTSKMRHLETHDTDKEHKCPHCDKKFNQVSGVWGWRGGEEPDPRQFNPSGGRWGGCGGLSASLSLSPGGEFEGSLEDSHRGRAPEVSGVRQTVHHFR